MRRPAALLAAAVLGGTAILLIARFIGSRADPAPDPSTLPTGSNSPEGPALAAPVLHSGRVDVRGTAPQGEPSAAAAASAGVLLVRVLAKQTGAPVPGVRIHASIQDRAGTADASDWPTTGEDGRAELELPSGVALEVSALAEGRDVESVRLDIPALQPSERRDLVLRVGVGDDLRFFGRVVREDGSTPVPGARAAVATERGVRSRSSAGPDGIFEVSLASWKEPHVRVEAEGYALYVVRRLAGHDTPDRALLIRLSKAATLDARVVDAAGSGIVGATVGLSAPGLLLPPRQEGGSAAVPNETWTQVVGEDGRCVIPGLVPDVGMRLEIRKDRELLLREPTPLVFRAGEVLEREWILGRGCDLHGLVLDEDGKTVSELGIWLAPGRTGATQYFREHDKALTTAQTTTDGEGRFVLRSVPEGTWSLGPAAEPRSRVIAPVVTQVEVSSAPSQEITLHVRRGLYIRGKVVDPEGVAATACSVFASPDGGDWAARDETDEVGAFVVGPLAEGEYFLTADAPGRYANSEPLRSSAGTEDVVLELRAAGGFRLHVLDGRTGEPCMADLIVSLDRFLGVPSGDGIGCGTGPDGTLEWEGLEPGTYGISARTGDGRFGVASGIRIAAGAEPADLEIAVSPGGVLKLRYEGKLARARVGLFLGGTRADWAGPVQAGEVVERKAPAGSLTLEIRLGPQREPRMLPVHLDPGELKEIVIRDED